MKFLVAFLAIFGYANTSLVAPLAYGVNLGNARSAAIDATVAAQDNARIWSENQAGAIEAQIQYNQEAARQAAEADRNINENVYWSRVSANQDAIASAQSQAAGLNGAISGRVGYAPIGIAPYGIAAPYINGLATLYGTLGLGLRAW